MMALRFLALSNRLDVEVILEIANTVEDMWELTRCIQQLCVGFEVFGDINSTGMTNK